MSRSATFDRPISRRAQGRAVRHRCRDAVLLHASRTDHRRRRSRRFGALCPMTRSAPALPAGYRLILLRTRSAAPTTRQSIWPATGAEEGTLVWALRADRRARAPRPSLGRRRRGNLYASLILRPDCPADGAAQLGFVAALGGRRALSRSWLPRSRATLLQMAERCAGERPQNRRHPARIGNDGDRQAGLSGRRRRDQPRGFAAGYGVSGDLDRGGRLGPTIAPAAMLEAFVAAFPILGCSVGATEGFAPVRAAWRAAAHSLAASRSGSGSRRATLFGRFLDIDQRGNPAARLRGRVPAHLGRRSLPGRR